MNEQLSTTNSLIDAAIASRLADDPLTAEQQLHTALNEARRHCNEILEARALIELARLMIFDSPQPDPHNTRRWLDRALEIYIKFGFDNGRAYALVMLGDLFLNAGTAG